MSLKYRSEIFSSSCLSVQVPGDIPCLNAIFDPGLRMCVNAILSRIVVFSASLHYASMGIAAETHHGTSDISDIFDPLPPTALRKSGAFCQDI